MRSGPQWLTEDGHPAAEGRTRCVRHHRRGTRCLALAFPVRELSFVPFSSQCGLRAVVRHLWAIRKSHVQTLPCSDSPSLLLPSPTLSLHEGHLCSQLCQHLCPPPCCAFCCCSPDSVSSALPTQPRPVQVHPHLPAPSVQHRSLDPSRIQPHTGLFPWALAPGCRLDRERVRGHGGGWCLVGGREGGKEAHPTPQSPHGRSLLHSSLATFPSLLIKQQIELITSNCSN